MQLEEGDGLIPDSPQNQELRKACRAIISLGKIDKKHLAHHHPSQNPPVPTLLIQIKMQTL